MASILVADNDPDVLQLIRTKLVTSGHDVLVVTDGAAALSAHLAARFDLLVLDVIMPKLSGLAVTREVRADHSGRRTQIMLLTARASERDRSAGFAAGADDYMTKPFSPQELVARVAVLLLRKPAESGV